MNGWGFGLITVMVAALWISWQNDRMDSMRSDVERISAIIAGHEAQRENNDRFDEIDGELSNGGEDDLSDYMRDAAGKLWSAP